MPEIPVGYQPLSGSERRPAANTRLLGPADQTERVQLTIILRRRPDGPPVPDFDFFAATPPGKRERLSDDAFAAKYGASPDDVSRVEDFARAHGLTIVETSAARRTVVVSGTVAQLQSTFGVLLGQYQRTIPDANVDAPQTETYRGRDGSIYVPSDLAAIVVGVFGLDNRRITKRNTATADPPSTKTITVPEITTLYRFPKNAAAGQTIGIFSEAGYEISDIQKYYATLPAGYTIPKITDVSVDSSNSKTPDPETTQDICIASTAAQGAEIAVYFTTQSQAGWVDLVNRVIHPRAGDPVCSVLSSSFYVANGDDAPTLAAEGVSTSWLTAVDMAFQDAAIQNVTICIASGDTGAQSKVGDGKAHVQFPGSDPWVLAVGGTTVGDVNGSAYDEYVWNDNWGATGGGVSNHFPLPSYQNGAHVPASLNGGFVGRGVPDVAANASPNSGYPMIVGGGGFTGNGTSASAPLWAGLIAVLNAALGKDVGFINPTLYALGGTGFDDIAGPPGPTNNTFAGVTGYPAGTAWNACTGWGSINGTALLAALRLPVTSLTHDPAVACNTDGRLEVFGVGSDMALQHDWQENPHAGPWSGWSSLGGGIVSDPSVFPNSDGRLEVFAAGTDTALWHIWQTAPHAGPWSAWSSLGGGIVGDPAVALNTDGRLEVFVRGTDNALWHIWQTAPHAGPWSAWSSLGGGITSDPAVFVNSDGRLEVFARGTDNALWHIWQTVPHGGPWSAWSSLGGGIVGDPAVIDNSDGRLEVFARGSNNALWHIWQTAPHAGPWSAWSSLGGGITSDPVAALNSDGRLEVFALGTNRACWHIWQTAPHAGPWSTWASL